MSEGAICCHVGACGSGKTYRLKLRVAAACRSGWGGRFIVADVKREWPQVKGTGELGPLLSGSPVRIARVTGVPPSDARERAQVFVAQPRTGLDAEAIRGWCGELAARALEWRGTILVLPEAYRYAREGERMHPKLEELSHEYRHAACGIWFDMQSFPELRKELLRRAGWIWIHGTGAHEDLERLHKMGGPALRAAALEAQRRNAAGRAGHHVIFRAAHPFPPFVVYGPEGAEVARFGDTANAGGRARMRGALEG